MRLPDETALLLQQREFIRGSAGVIHLAVRCEVFFEGLTCSTFRRLHHMAEEKRLGKHEHVVAPEIGVRLLARYEEEIAIRKPLTAFEIHFLLVETELTCIGRMGITVEICEYCRVDSKC